MGITISGFTTTQSSSTIPAGPTSVAGGKAAEQKSSIQDVAADKVSLGNQNSDESLTYLNPKSKGGSVAPTQQDLQAMLEESDRQAQEMINLILSMVNRQGTTLEKIISGEQVLDADPATVAAAQEAVSEDGEWGVEKTAERILNFAKNVIGGDESKIDKIRAGVEQGFNEAKKILGDKLPEISEKTYAAVMAEFDRWKSEGLANVEPSDSQNTKDAVAS